MRICIKIFLHKVIFPGTKKRLLSFIKEKDIYEKEKK